MKRLISILATVITAALVAACAPTSSTRLSADQLAEIENSRPVCSTEAECDVMWAAARTWILNNAGFKFQNLTDDYMDTYNPSQYSVNLAARVNKQPLGKGRYKIVGDVWCANIYGCRPSIYESLMDFNRTVADAAELVE